MTHGSHGTAPATPATAGPTGWSELDDDAVRMIRGIVSDLVDAAGGGHPGSAISLAPVMQLLFGHVIRHDPRDPSWEGRDRFVLSAGHISLALYTQLWLHGYPVSLADIRTTRTMGNVAPGHPERDLVRGIEMSTGPLGEGLAASVGMAMAARRRRGMFDPTPAVGDSPFDHFVYVLASDGDIQEGVVSEAASLAGRQRLGRLIVIWDDNRISVDDDTAIATAEDTPAKFAAMGWHTERVDWARDGAYVEDIEALHDALTRAQGDDRPSLIALRTLIAWPAPGKNNTADVHGGPLGPEETRALKRAIGLRAEQPFWVDENVRMRVQDRGLLRREEIDRWHEDFAVWRTRNPDASVLWDRLTEGRRPEGWGEALAEVDVEHAVSTRVAFAKSLNASAHVLPELWAGSADMNASTGTYLLGERSFLPSSVRTSQHGQGDPYGRVLHFGVREHAMAAALTGIALEGRTTAVGGTFLMFAFHMLPSIRLAALMGLPTVYVFTHDSIGLGEDGATHQPVEHLAALRAMPRLTVFRPADAAETVAGWRHLMSDRTRGPVAVILSRQTLPALVDAASRAGDDRVRHGAYAIVDHPAPDVALLATGSEVSLAVDAAQALSDEGLHARVISMPSWEWYAEQSQEYRTKLLPPTLRARVSIEAASRLGWREFVGDAGEVISVDDFGQSAPGPALLAARGFTVDAVVRAARTTIARAGEPS
jgi:transketolase